MKRTLYPAFGCLISSLAMICVSTVSARADDESWRAKTIADALQAAPPSATHDATILGWTSDGELVLARYPVFSGSRRDSRKLPAVDRREWRISGSSGGVFCGMGV